MLYGLFNSVGPLARRQNTECQNSILIIVTITQNYDLLKSLKPNLLAGCSPFPHLKNKSKMISHNVTRWTISQKYTWSIIRMANMEEKTYLLGRSFIPYGLGYSQTPFNIILTISQWRLVEIEFQHFVFGLFFWLSSAKVKVFFKI